jgi:hypothetical protein
MLLPIATVSVPKFSRLARWRTYPVYLPYISLERECKIDDNHLAGFFKMENPGLVEERVSSSSAERSKKGSGP